MSGEKLCMLCMTAWIFACFGICTYLVFWRGENGWWYLLAFVLAASVKCRTRQIR